MGRLRNYKELSRLRSFEERFEYLRLSGKVGMDTFGHDRWLNQAFYASPEWKRVRDYVIFRDHGCDLGIEGHEIHGRVLVHHMNPATIEGMEARDAMLMDPDNLITVSHGTHNAIHYGDASLLAASPVERRKGDTCPWKC